MLISSPIPRSERALSVCPFPRSPAPPGVLAFRDCLDHRQCPLHDGLQDPVGPQPHGLAYDSDGRTRVLHGTDKMITSVYGMAITTILQCFVAEEELFPPSRGVHRERPQELGGPTRLQRPGSLEPPRRGLELRCSVASYVCIAAVSYTHLTLPTKA